MQDRQDDKLPAITSYDAVSNAKVRPGEAESHQTLALEANGDGVALFRCPDLCMILDTPKGRGVFATRTILSRTVVDVSPVLLFQPREYEEHGRFTQLYNYTYVWPAAAASKSTVGSAAPQTAEQDKRPRQALPLGLGSLFNHTSRASRLNVGWTRDVAQDTITYTALRQIEAGEELCISYGTNLWFENAVDEGHSEDEQGEGEGTPLERLASGVFDG